MVSFWAISSFAFGQKAVHTLYLIGDAGKPHGSDASGEALTLLKQELQTCTDSVTVLFLGDNIYPAGMPDKMEEGRKEAEKNLDASLDAVKDFSGKVIFIPGNHDWYQGSFEGNSRLENQANYIDSVLQGHAFIPADGGVGVQEVAVGDSIALLVLDSQWWLTAVEANELGDTTTLIRQLDSLCAKNHQAGKKVVVAAHHPLVSNGLHGGHFPARAHLFPLEEFGQKWWGYIPLPIFGSIYVGYRKRFGYKQDVVHKGYGSFVTSVSSVVNKYPGTFYVAGHDHCLQMLEVDGIYHVGSGAGSKLSYVKEKGALFARQERGFCKLTFYEGGTFSVEFITPSERVLVSLDQQVDGE